MGKKARRARRRNESAAERARYLAERETATEQHVRTRLAREDDPDVVQRTRAADGEEVLSFPGASGEDLRALLEAQRTAFVARFGREPGPDDPVFFDDPGPDVTDAHPQHRTVESVVAALSQPGMAEELGLEPAFLKALIELEYAVSDDNRHLFTAHEVAAFEEAVERHRRTS